MNLYSGIEKLKILFGLGIILNMSCNTTPDEQGDLSIDYEFKSPLTLSDLKYGKLDGLDNHVEEIWKRAIETFPELMLPYK